MSNIYVDKMAEIIALLNPAGASQLEALNALLGSELPLLRAAVAAAGAEPDLAGASWPATPAAGQLRFRTDLGLLCYYDGTRWLTATLYELSIPLHMTLPVVDTGAASIFGFVASSPAYARHVLGCRVSFYVQNTNNSSNYWTITAQDSSNGNTFGSGTTGSIAANVWGSIDIISSGYTSSAVLQLTMKDTGSPGAIYVSAVLRYRLVIP